MAVIDNRTSNTLVSGTSGADSIKNTGGTGVTLHGGKSNDTLTGSSSAEVFQFRSDGGNDVITNFGSNDTLCITAGNYSTYFVDGNDLIVSVKGASYSGTVRLLDSADDSIRVKDRNSDIITVKAELANVIDNRTRNTIVSGSSDADSVYNYAKNVTIQAGAGNDTVETYGNKVSVDGGKGNDSLKTTGGTGVTLHGGAGNDTLTGSSSAEVFQFRSDGGNDVITNFGTNDTLRITAGNYSTYFVDGNDLIVSVKGASYSGTVRLVDSADDSIRVKDRNGDIITVKAEPVNDIVTDIINRNRNTIIDGTNGRDFIFNYAKNVTANGGAGDDTVISYGNDVNLNAGAGNDIVHNTGGARVTLNGGLGDDTLIGSSSAEFFLIQSDGGNDLISEFGANDTLKIADGAITSHYSTGDDYIINIGSSIITIEGIGSNPILVADAGGNRSTINVVNMITNDKDNMLVSGTKDRDSITNSGSGVTVSVGGGDDTVINSGGGNVYRFSSADGNNLLYGLSADDTVWITAGSLQSHYADGDNYVLNLKGKNYSGAVTLKGSAFTPIHIRKSATRSDVINYDIANFSSYTLVSGTDDDDMIYNGGEYVTINAGAGDDTLRSAFASGNVYQYNLGDGNDLIQGFDATDTLRIVDATIGSHYQSGDNYVLEVSGGGSITLEGWSELPDNVVEFRTGSQIVNEEDDVIVNGTDGDDIIYNECFLGATINAGDGNDRIYDFSNGRTMIYAGKGDDTVFCDYDPYIWEKGYSVFRYVAGDGNDVIQGFTHVETLNIVGGSITSHYSSGNDYVIEVAGAGGTGSITLKDWRVMPDNVVALSADGRITNDDDYVLVEGTDADDYIYNTGIEVTINARSGNDTISHYHTESGISVNAGDGNDLLLGDYYYSTIKVGAGDDTVSVEGSSNVYQLSSADGNNILYGLTADDTIRITAGSIRSHYADGEDYVLNLQGQNYSGTVTLTGVGDIPIRVRESNGQTTFINYNVNNTDYALVNGTDGNDKIINEGNHSTINGGKGNDIIDNRVAYSVLLGGEGNDFIVSNKNENYGWYSTLNGGAGDDTLTGSRYADVFQYRAGDGNDFIINFDSDDMLRIIDGSITSHYANGDDYVLEVSGDGGTGSITLKGWSELPENIFELPSGAICNNYNSVTVNGTEGDDTVHNIGDEVSINADAGNDLILGKYNDSTIKVGAGDDTISVSGSSNEYQFSSADGNNLLYGLNEYDTVRITAGSLQSHYADGDNYVLNLKGAAYSGSVTLAGVGDIPIRVRESNGRSSFINYNINNTNDYRLVNGTDSDDKIYNGGGYSTVDGGAGNDVIDNRGDHSVLLGGAGNDYIVSNRNRTWGWYATLNGGAGDDTLTGSNKGDVFIYNAGDGNDIITNFGSDDTLRIIDSAIASHYAVGKNYVLEISGDDGAGSITLKGWSSLPENILEIPPGVIYNEDDYATVNGTAGDDTVYNIGYAVSINSGTGNDLLLGDYYYSTLKVGADDDTVSVEGSSNVYQFSSADGNNILYGFTEYDTVRITAGSLQSHYADGDNYVLNLKGAAYSGSVTLAGVGDIPIRVRESNGRSSFINYNINNADGSALVNGTDSDDKIYNGGGYSTVDGGAGNDVIDNRGDHSVLLGGAGNDYIVSNRNRTWGWYATLNGGAGDDTLTGSNKGDVFIYSAGDGADVIVNFGEITANNSEDTLHITDGTIDGSVVCGSDLILNVGSGSITLKDIVGKTIKYQIGDGDIETLRAEDGSSSQLPTEGYWFDQAADNDPLDGILDAKNISVGLDDDFAPKNILQPSNVITGSRHRSKK